MSRDEWGAARKKLLTKEKELTRQRDAVSAERRRASLAQANGSSRKVPEILRGINRAGYEQRVHWTAARWWLRGEHINKEECMRLKQIGLACLCLVIAASFAILALVVLEPRASLAIAQGSSMTDEQKIANAMSAAPADISRNATIKDWPAKQGDEMRVLRKGSIDWLCLPDDPSSPGNDPSCLDKEWQKLLEAIMSKKKPSITTVGIGYGLSTNSEGSNTDPFATKATPHNEWHKVGPIIGLLLPDAQQLDGLPSSPEGAKPYVMYKGTPYAHLMVPVADVPKK